MAALGAGLLAGGVTTATVLWLASGLVEPTPEVGAQAIVVGIGILAVGDDIGMWRLPRPQTSRQIPRDVFYAPETAAAVRFGFELGTGVRTFLTATSPYVLAVAVLLVGESLLSAVLAGAAFGLGRFLMPLCRALSSDGERWDDLLARRLRVIVVVSSLVSAGSAIWLASLPVPW